MVLLWSKSHVLYSTSFSQSVNPSKHSLRCGLWEVKYLMTGLSSTPLMTLCCCFWVVPVDHFYLAVYWLHLTSTHTYTNIARFRCLARHVQCQCPLYSIILFKITFLCYVLDYAYIGTISVCLYLFKTLDTKAELLIRWNPTTALFTIIQYIIFKGPV